jgi:SNF2 family DNA or RNA helicase
MLNHVDELWSILHRIDPVAYPRYWSFVGRYAVFGGYKDKQIVGVKNEKELTDSEVIDELRLTRVDQDEPDDIENALTKFLRLKQICGTTYAFTGEDHSSKLEQACADDLELLENGEKVVVFTQFRDVQECYIRRMSKEGVPIWHLNGDVPQVERQPTVKEWGLSRNPGVIVCMLQVAGVGLNMTAARHGSFLDKLFVPGLNKQAIDLLHRIGQDKSQPVQIREYICRNTIENRVNQILSVKSKLFGEIVESDPNWKRKLYAALMEDAA